VGQAVFKGDVSVVSPDYGSPLNDFLRQVNQMIIFDPSVFDTTSGGDVLQQITELAAKLVTTANPGFFRFFINPTKLDFAITKIVNEVLEKKGFETLQWNETPNQMISMTFAGMTGTMMPIQALRALGVRDTKYSVNWMRFQQLQSLVLNTTNDLKMLYDGKLYEGYLVNFSYTEDANQPFFISYSFTFKAYPDRIKNIAAPNTVFSAIPSGSTIANNLSGLGV
jgi:hypothetical protein